MTLIFVSYALFISTNHKIIFPHSLVSFANSYWGGLFIFSLFISEILSNFSSKKLQLKDLLSIESNIVTLVNNKLFCSVFSCSPPILHDKKDFSLFLSNFQPLTIEIMNSNQIINFVVYGNDKKMFETRIKECFNLLSSFFSKVTILKSTNLEKFMVGGLSYYYYYDISSKQKTTVKCLDEFKEILANSQKNKSGRFLNSRIKNEQNLQYSTEPVLLFYLYGKKGINASFSTKTNHFRGVKIGATAGHMKDGISLEVEIEKKLVTNALHASLRIPEKENDSIDLQELERMYFFTIHKYFKFYFKSIPDETFSTVSSPENDVEPEKLLVQVENQPSSFST